VKWQTLTLMAIQVVPLFIVPEILLPYLGSNGAFDAGLGLWIKNTFFPGESWWRAYGLVLAWPLFVYNWFTAEPIWGWLVLGFLQTFVMIPAMIYFWGKGAYCGWICSCGALAETLGDTHRHKMPHGPAWNRLNLAGQLILFCAAALMVLRILGWILGPDSVPARLFKLGFESELGYGWTVDLFLAGVIGYGLYFWFSGRVWCRFFCPLAALMHVYHRFSRFRILADKKKCISCNVCTAVCHQGIDVMSFANKGEPMADPQCVRCSACVAACPTGVLSFGQVDPRTEQAIKSDPAWLAASPVMLREIGVNGRPHRL
jgi:polyferredoxin